MRTSVKTRTTIWGAFLALGLVPLSATLIGAQEPSRAPAGAPAPATADATASAAGHAAPGGSYVGSGSCTMCHAKVGKTWPTSAHGTALSQADLPTDLRGCEACHGPAGEHISSKAKVKPSIPTAEDPKASNALCGTCHFQDDASKAPKEWQNISPKLFARSQHGRKGLSCLSCHTGHPNGTDKQLIKPASELCLSCHGDVMESSPGKKAAYTHMPVAQGNCLTCHDPHGTPDHNMVIPNVQKACVQCHDTSTPEMATAHKGYSIADSKCAQCHDPHSHDQQAKLIAPRQHVPFKSGNCQMCHTAPVAGQPAGSPAGLVKPAKELCFQCHPAEKLMADSNHTHVPAKEGMCLSCHNPHASREKALMKTKVAYACFQCHSKVEDDTVAEHRHAVLDQNLNCLLCHKPHSAPQPKLLVKDEQALCGQCHKHSFSHPIGRKADGTVVLNPTNGQPLNCASCHDIHGGKFDSMTIASKDRDLCVKCHTELEH